MRIGIDIDKVITNLNEYINHYSIYCILCEYMILYYIKYVINI